MPVSRTTEPATVNYPRTELTWADLPRCPRNARIVAKAVRSAVANAENNYSLDPRELRVKEAFVGTSATTRRMRPRARGRGDIIRHRRSNITIVVEDEV